MNPIFLKRKKACAKQNKKRSTGPSRVVPHRSTTPARTSLTSLFGWEAVSLVDMAALVEGVRLLYMNRIRHQRHFAFSGPCART